MITYPKADFQFIDVAARSDSAAASRNNQDFAAIAHLKNHARMQKYGTMEQNQFILDGSRTIFPQKPQDISYWSTERSDEGGFFISNPNLVITFSKPHSSVGLTLYFGGAVPGEVSITWYTAGGTKLESEIFYPDAEEFFCRKPVWNYGSIQIEFLRTSWPDRYIKMDYLEYGRIWELSRNNIKSASVCEELDPISATLAINTANIEMIDEKGEFDLEKEGLWSFLQKNQSIRLLESVDGMETDCGTFYLDTWEAQQNTVRFSMIDPIGRMDKTRFCDGRIYIGVPAGTIIDAIMESCGVTEYHVEEEIASIPLSGWLGIQSHRQALQQVVFACGCAAGCSRSAQIRIFQPDRYISSTIGLERKFLGTKIMLDEYVSGVTVSCMQYNLAEETSEISKNVLPAGDTRLEFSEPYLPGSITLSAGRVKQAETNYAVIAMSEEGECVISGRRYEGIEITYSAAVPMIEAGESENVIGYNGVTLMNAGMVNQVAQNILRCHQSRQVVEFKFLNQGEAVGNWCSIAQLGGQHSVTSILSQTLDLTGGNLSSARCRGYSKSVTEYCYAGSEMYAGEQCL